LRRLTPSSTAFSHAGVGVAGRGADMRIDHTVCRHDHADSSRKARVDRGGFLPHRD
jgi:hypothetical protein